MWFIIVWFIPEINISIFLCFSKHIFHFWTFTDDEIVIILIPQRFREPRWILWISKKNKGQHSTNANTPLKLLFSLEAIFCNWISLSERRISLSGLQVKVYTLEVNEMWRASTVFHKIIKNIILSHQKIMGAVFIFPTWLKKKWVLWKLYNVFLYAWKEITLFTIFSLTSRIYLVST
jgi:hypothetical protein